jgi:hypothetical protein
MESPIKSRRGVYYDRSKSPYEFNAYGLLFKFSSRKKLDMFSRELPIRLMRAEKDLSRLSDFTKLHYEINDSLKRRIAQKLYSDIEGE